MRNLFHKIKNAYLRNWLERTVYNLLIAIILLLVTVLMHFLDKLASYLSP